MTRRARRFSMALTASLAPSGRDTRPGGAGTPNIGEGTNTGSGAGAPPGHGPSTDVPAVGRAAGADRRPGTANPPTSPADVPKP